MYFVQQFMSYSLADILLTLTYMSTGLMIGVFVEHVYIGLLLTLFLGPVGVIIMSMWGGLHVMQVFK